MKHSKLLKSAVLSTALLWGGATHAQSTDTGSASITINAAPSITITTTELNFGSHTGAAASEVSLTCATAGDATTGANKVTDGTCGEITLSASAGTLSYRIAVLPGVFRDSSGTALTGQPVMFLYEGGDGTTTVVFTAESITSGTDVSYVLGGTYNIPANTAAGTYTGDYTVNISIG